MEENKEELSPEEMRNVSGGTDLIWDLQEPEYVCPDCGFTTHDYRKFLEHRASHSLLDDWDPLWHR